MWGVGIETHESTVRGKTLEEFVLIAVGYVPPVTADGTVNVEVNCGRWIVKCPWCKSAGLASETDARFFCVECRNSAGDGKWLHVIWPKDRGLIEEQLMVRPDPEQRNWKAGESVDELSRENAAHGFGPDRPAPQIRRITLDEAARLLAGKPTELALLAETAHQHHLLED